MKRDKYRVKGNIKIAIAIEDEERVPQQLERSSKRAPRTYRHRAVETVSDV